MPETFAVDTVAYIGVDSLNAEVIAQEDPAKGRRKKRAWTRAAMLWGDAVFIRKIEGEWAEVSAKGHRLRLRLNQLTNEGILSLWQVDCGQGDAALLRFPDGSFAAIDMGPPRRGAINSNSGRIALDFFKWIAFDDNNWRFQGDHTDEPFHFEWVVLTHPDEDHAGGAKEFAGKLGEHWSLGTLFHCGLGRFKGEARPQVPASSGEAEQPGFSQLGPVREGAYGELYLSQLIDGAADIEEFSEATTSRPWFLSGNYADVLKQAAAHVGGAVGEISRLSHRSDGAELSRGRVDVKVLGPVEGAVGEHSALRYLDNNKLDGFYNLTGPSLSRNGHSVVLRLDFKDIRILMTGDLNFRSHALLLQEWPPDEFSCHVGKACHHGSEDISWTFLQAMDPMAVMFSSGDQETHVHPRALALGLSGAFAKRFKRRTSAASAAEQTFETETFAGFEEPKLFSPLLYSTELSRSARLRTDMKAYRRTETSNGEDYEDLGGIHFKGSSDKDEYVAQRDVWIVDRLTYGLINVRTDGKKVIIAVLEEGSEPEYHIEKFTPSKLVPL